MNRRRRGWRGIVAGALITVALLGPAVPTATAAPSISVELDTVTPALSAWTGGISLYRTGVFTTQKTWLWCTAAAIQISRNIVFHRTDHAYSSQRTYFYWMRAHNRYSLPLSAGVDAQGWAMGFAHYVNASYKLYAWSTFGDALKAAVTHIRRTNRPAGIAVDRGNHAWLITGFTATADPAVTTSFTVTSVRVVGPLWGLQSVNGYDMQPNTRLTPTQLHHYFTPWYYAPKRMVWDGKYVEILP